MLRRIILVKQSETFLSLTKTKKKITELNEMSAIYSKKECLFLHENSFPAHASHPIAHDVNCIFMLKSLLRLRTSQ